VSRVSLTVIGGGSEIGANSYVLSFDGHQVVLDCGLHPKKEGKESLPALSLLKKAPEAVIVSHGHIDHCGAVPCLIRRFPQTLCYTTKPTMRIMGRMLHNSVSVMGMLASERGIADYPLYSRSDIDFAFRQTTGMDFDEEFALTWDSPIRAAFHHAGHVLGSAGVWIHGDGHTVFYTGDICLTNQELMGGFHPLDHAGQVDTLVIECTRGAHANGKQTTFQGEVKRFAKETSAVLKKGGTVLVPSFALGRTQELLNIIARLQDGGRLPNVPVYVSGLGRAVYEIYNKFTEYLRPDATLRPLRNFRRVGDVWERAVARDLIKDPCIIVATSGMMVENTPSAMIARELVKHPEHAIFFAGYLDPDTLGYKLLHAGMGDALRFETNGRAVRVNLANRQRFNFSAHASREELCSLVDRVRPRNVVFVHGDRDAIEWMRDNCDGPDQKFAPALGDTVVLEG
jgi:Cft2 family RNA processing exonuclease